MTNESRIRVTHKLIETVFDDRILIGSLLPGVNSDGLVIRYYG